MSVRRILFLAPAQAVTRLFPSLKDAGLEVGIAENIRGVSSFIRQSPPALILTRTALPGYKAEDLLSVGADDPEFPPVIVISDRGNPEEALKYMELGAKDYWLEPLDAERILAVLPAQRKTRVPLPDAGPAPVNSTLGGQRPKAGPRIVGNHPVVNRVLALAKQVAPSKATVLISGESGTGKEMFARFVHAASGREGKPFIAVNCAALPEHLLESELFGHEKGAFTGAINRKLGKFELADGGTLLLDEISEMDLPLQAKLLRVLQEGEIDRVGGMTPIKVDVRIIATTNRDLESWVKEGKFRQDLFFRLNVIPLRLPALRERGEDIERLALFFLDMYIKEYGLPATSLSPAAKEWLMSYDWPGNVRELQNLMERAALLAVGRPIEPAHFLLDSDEWPLFMENGNNAEGSGESAISSNMTARAGESCAESGAASSGQSETVDASAPFDKLYGGGVMPLHEVERIMIMRGLEQTDGNRTQAAELLGISVRTLRNKLSEYRELGLTDS